MLSDARGLYPRLTARENIVYYGRLHGLARDAAQARAEALAERWTCARCWTAAPTASARASG